MGKMWRLIMNYNFENKTFVNIFEYGLKLAEEKSEYCSDFFNAYINHIFKNNFTKPESNVKSIKDATIAAKDNFGYYAGYYGNDVRKLIAETYNALHPYFGNRYDITNKEAFEIGKQVANGTYIKKQYNW